MRKLPPPSSVHFVITGGTIDSYYEATKDTAVPSKESIIPKFMGIMQMEGKPKFTTVCMKDSRDITDSDLRKIKSTIEKSPYQKIIVTHGTYTMPDTARFLAANLKNNKKTIILTGSMIPIVGFAPSDGPFNLGYAIAKAEVLPAGVYVAMNGRIFDPAEVRKNLYKGAFASIFGEK